MTRKPPQWAEKLIQKVDKIDLEVRSLGVGMEEIRDDVKLLAEGQNDIRKTLDEHSATLDEHTEMIGNLAVDMTVVKSTLKDHTEKIDNLAVDMAIVKNKLDNKVDREEFDAL